MRSETDARTALVLSGGGARAAYEVGVLKAIRDLSAPQHGSPFSIYCGVSGGAINAAFLGVGADDFGASIGALDAFWSELRAGMVFRADPLSVALSGGRWLAALSTAWMFGTSPRGLFDNGPLQNLLDERLDFTGLETAITNQSLRALSITCSGYASGQCVSFFQGRADLDPWQRVQRIGAHVTLNAKHIMASMAVPFMFSAVKIHREYFGDGVMREVEPLSPAIRLGAEKILVIGTGNAALRGERISSKDYPSLAESAGHVLAGIYVDSLTADIERMQQVNRLLAGISAQERAERSISWRPIDLLVIQPSEHLDLLAARMASELPWAVRTMLRGVGLRGDAGGAFASYLLFEASFARQLIDLGYRDAMNKRNELAAFLNLETT